MTVGIRYQAFLDPKRCFELWFSCGSLYKTQKILIDEGVFNPKTERAPTIMGIWNAAWRWGLENQPEAREMVEDVYMASGELLTDAEWAKMINDKAIYLYSKKKYTQFIDEK